MYQKEHTVGKELIPAWINCSLVPPSTLPHYSLHNKGVLLRHKSDHIISIQNSPRVSPFPQWPQPAMTSYITLCTAFLPLSTATRLPFPHLANLPGAFTPGRFSRPGWLSCSYPHLHRILAPHTSSWEALSSHSSRTCPIPSPA